MRTGIIFSILLHGAVFSLAYVTWPVLMRDPAVPDPEILAVELVTIDTVNRVPEELVRQQPEPQKQKPEPPKPEPQKPEPQKPEPQKPEPVKTVDAPPADAVPPPPEKKPEARKPETKPQPKPPARKPVAAPQAKPKPPKKFDDRKIAALIDKSLKQQEDSREAREKKLAAAVADAQVVSLDAKRMTATLAAVVQAQVHKCWALDPGLKDLENMQVRIEIALNPDGTIQGWPEMDANAVARMRDPSQGPYRAFAESAQRAILRCAPYELPREMYTQWRNIALNFDPREVVN